jgi:hypothetical protein
LFDASNCADFPFAIKIHATAGAGIFGGTPELHQKVSCSPSKSMQQQVPQSLAAPIRSAGIFAGIDQVSVFAGLMPIASNRWCRGASNVGVVNLTRIINRRANSLA